jgi:hypothetical protein
MTEFYVVSPGTAWPIVPLSTFISLIAIFKYFIHYIDFFSDYVG